MCRSINFALYGVSVKKFSTPTGATNLLASSILAGGSPSSSSSGFAGSLFDGNFDPSCGVFNLQFLKRAVGFSRTNESVRRLIDDSQQQEQQQAGSKPTVEKSTVQDDGLTGRQDKLLLALRDWSKEDEMMFGGAADAIDIDDILPASPFNDKVLGAGYAQLPSLLTLPALPTGTSH